MLDKTLALLRDIPPGTYVSPDKPCFDEEEIKELAQALNRLLYSPSELRKRLQELGVNVSPANFYSEIPFISDIERTLAATPKDGIYNAIFDRPVLSQWLEKLQPYAAEFDPPQDAPEDEATYRWKCQFSNADAMAYYCFVRAIKPKKIIEIGSGFSTLIARDACIANGTGSIISIEPYPRPFLKTLEHVTLIETPAQDLNAEFLNENLSDGDILFIDSTHTVKHGSDVLHIYLTLLPSITKNIYVHVHDIHLPFPFPMKYLRDIQIYWTEQYLLYAYLLENIRAKVIFGTRYHAHHHTQRLEALMHGRATASGGSLWFTHDRRRPTGFWQKLSSAFTR